MYVSVCVVYMCCVFTLAEIVAKIPVSKLAFILAMTFLESSSSALTGNRILLFSSVWAGDSVTGKDSERGKEKTLKTRVIKKKSVVNFILGVNWSTIEYVEEEEKSNWGCSLFIQTRAESYCHLVTVFGRFVMKGENMINRNSYIIKKSTILT